jgi:hypothetical protein
VHRADRADFFGPANTGERPPVKGPASLDRCDGESAVVTTVRRVSIAAYAPGVVLEETAVATTSGETA